MQRFELFTTSYTRFRPEMGTPVQASNGRPRYRLAYDLAWSCKETYPAWALVKGNYSKDVFQARYWESLDGVGVDRLASRFRAIATGSGDSRLVLLCFEAIEKSPDNWCHRRMFAEWWATQTGDEVRELGPTEPESYATLF